MKTTQRYIGCDTHLDTWMERLEGREERVGEDTHDGFKMVWTKQEILDATDWSDANYQKRTPKERGARLSKMGVTLHSLTGKGDDTEAVVTIHNYAWYHLLLRGKGKYSQSAEAYMDNLFCGTGYLNVGGVNLAATLTEFAQAYAHQFGESVSAVANKLDRMRSNIKPYGYLLNGKDSPAKMIRVKQRGSDTWLKGPRAILLDYTLRRAYAEFYEDMNAKVPYDKKAPLRMRLQAKQLRKDMAEDFTKHLMKKHKLDLIRSHRSSTISEEGRSDYNAIISLYVSGATFTEIRSFLAERPKYWEEQQKEG